MNPADDTDATEAAAANPSYMKGLFAWGRKNEEIKPSLSCSTTTATSTLNDSISLSSLIKSKENGKNEIVELRRRVRELEKELFITKENLTDLQSNSEIHAELFSVCQKQNKQYKRSKELVSKLRKDNDALHRQINECEEKFAALETTMGRDVAQAYEARLKKKDDEIERLQVEVHNQTKTISYLVDKLQKKSDRLDAPSLDSGGSSWKSTKSSCNTSVTSRCSQSTQNTNVSSQLSRLRSRRQLRGDALRDHIGRYKASDKNLVKDIHSTMNDHQEHDQQDDSASKRRYTVEFKHRRSSSSSNGEHNNISDMQFNTIKEETTIIPTTTLNSQSSLGSESTKILGFLQLGGESSSTSTSIR